MGEQGGAGLFLYIPNSSVFLSLTVFDAPYRLPFS